MIRAVWGRTGRNSGGGPQRRKYTLASSRVRVYIYDPAGGRNAEE